jgi:hypothetical protein
MANSEKLIVIDISEDYLAKRITSSENIIAIKNVKNEIGGIFENIEDASLITNEMNSKVFELMKSNIFNEMYENILVKYFSDFYKTISTTSEFTNVIELILLHYFKVKNDFDSNSIINIENYMQQTFISKVSSDNENQSLITAITSDNILQKNDTNNNTNI